MIWNLVNGIEWQWLVNVPILHITQVLGIVHLQIFQGDVKEIPKSWDIYQPLWKHHETGSGGARIEGLILWYTFTLAMEIHHLEVR